MVRFQEINKYRDRETSTTTKQTLNRYFSLFLLCHPGKYYKVVFLHFILLSSLFFFQKYRTIAEEEKRKQVSYAGQIASEVSLG